MEIRPARAEDFAQIAAIYAPFVRNTTVSFELEAPDAADMSRRWRAGVDGGYPYLVADCGGAVAGYACATVFRSRPAYRQTVESSVYVAPSALRQGVAGALMRALMDGCRKRGFAQMIAGITDDPAAGAASAASIAFHEAMGFGFVGRFAGIGHKFGRDIDVVFYQRGLRADPSRTSSARS